MDTPDPFADFITAKPTRPAPRPAPLQAPFSPAKPEGSANPFSPLTGKLAHLPTPARKAPGKPQPQASESTSSNADWDYTDFVRQLAQPSPSKPAAQDQPLRKDDKEWDFTQQIAQWSLEKQVTTSSSKASPDLMPWEPLPYTSATPHSTQDSYITSSIAEHSDSWIQGGDLLLPDSAQLPLPSQLNVESATYVEDDDIFGLSQMRTSGAQSLPPPPDYDSLYGPAVSTPVASKPEPWDTPSKPPTAPGPALTVDTAFAAAGDSSNIAGPSPRIREADTSTRASSICINLRNAPLQPKYASRPTLLASINSCLIAAPAAPPAGGIMQWSCVDSDPVRPDGSPSTPFEDWDAVASGQIRLPEGISGVVTCMHVDHSSHTVWTGTSDGWVVRWQAFCNGGGEAHPQSAWQASQVGRISSIALTKWGEVWTGSSSGSVRVWTYAPRKGDTKELMKPLKVRELKKKNGGRPHSKTRFVVATPNGKLVWTAGKNTISIWSAYDGFLYGTLKGSMDPNVDDTYVDPNRGIGDSAALAKIDPIRSDLDLCTTDDEEVGGLRSSAAMTKALVNASKAAKAWDKWGRKVVANFGSQRRPGELGPEERSPPGGLSIKGMLATPGTSDGLVWVMYKSGLIECFTELGRFMWRKDLKTKLTCMALAGSQICVGGADGRIRMLRVVGNVTTPRGMVGLSHISVEICRSWLAHECNVFSMTVVGSLLYSLAENGAIKGWSVTPPPESAITTWQGELTAATTTKSLKVLAGTWNVNEERPSAPSLAAWLREPSQKADLVCVCLQELEMGTSSVAMDAALSFWDQSKLEQGTANAQWWVDELRNILGTMRWERLAMRQMSGMLVVVFVDKKHKDFVGEVATASVGCGVMGVGGNKGGVAISMTLYRKRVVVVCSHLAAHQEKVEERNADYRKISRTIKFTNTPIAGSNDNGASTPGAGSDGDAQNSGGDESPIKKWASEDSEQMQVLLERAPLSRGLRDADLVIWAGDFNYRLCLRLLSSKLGVVDSYGVSYEYVLDELKDLRDKAKYKKLLLGDQLTEERVVKKSVFEGMDEAPIDFPPTYKFEKTKKTTDLRDMRTSSVPTYEQGEKKRIPSWTDRILFRGSGPAVTDPDVKVECQQYDAIMDVYDSDHKPVFAVFQVALRYVDLSYKRAASLRLFNSIDSSDPPPPTLNVSPTRLALSEREASHISVANTSDCECMFHISGSLTSLGALPLWLDLYPQEGVIRPGEAAVICVSGGKPGWDSQGMRQGHSCTLTIAAAPLDARGSTNWQRYCSSSEHQVTVTLR